MYAYLERFERFVTAQDWKKEKLHATIAKLTQITEAYLEARNHTLYVPERCTRVNHAMYAVNPDTRLENVDSGHTLNVNYRAMMLKTVNGSVYQIYRLIKIKTS